MLFFLLKISCFDMVKKSVFGWATIVEMYKQKVDRFRQQQTGMVPQLKEVHVLGDAWTKLNVSPAKIMQVCSHAYVLILPCLFAYSKSKY